MVKGPLPKWGTCFHTVKLDEPYTLIYLYSAVAVGCGSGDITIIDGTTGSQTAILSGHTG